MIQSFKDEVTMIKYQLKERVVLNQLQANEISRISHENSVGLGMLGRLDYEFTRLMSLVSQHDGSLQEKDSVNRFAIPLPFWWGKTGCSKCLLRTNSTKCCC